MADYGGKFSTSLSVLFAILYVVSSPLHVFDLQFVFGSASKTFPPMEKVFRRNITGPILHNRVFVKGFIVAVWPKKCTKLSEDGKPTVKKGRALSGFLNYFFQAVLSGLSLVWKFSRKYILPCNSV